MGLAIAERLARLGAKVILIAGPVSIQCEDPNILRVDVVSAAQMYIQVLNYLSQCNGAVMVAAVADFSPLFVDSEKFKRSSGNLILELKPNPDIAAALGRIKRADQILVGFALETTNDESKAMGKLQAKNLDLIILNSLNDKGSGFQFDTNQIRILDKTGVIFTSGLKPKKEVAVDIVEKLMETENLISGLT